MGGNYADENNDDSSDLGLVAAAPIRASAEDYKWPNNIPPEAKQLMEPLPLSPTGQAVPGFPNGAPAVSADAPETVR